MVTNGCSRQPFDMHVGMPPRREDSLSLHMIGCGAFWKALRQLARDYPGRGAARITAAPIRHSPAPARSQRSGRCPSAPHIQNREAAM